MASFRSISTLALWTVIAGLLSLQGDSCAAGRDKPIYVLREPSYVKVYARDLEGEYIKIKDFFDRPLDPRDRYDKKVWKRKWLKGKKISKKQYVAFYTDSDLDGSGMLCLLPRSNKKATALAEKGLGNGDRIFITGRLMKHEIGDDDEPDLTFFMVDSIQRGHEEKKDEGTLTVSVGKERMQVPSTGKWAFKCPKCGKPAFTIRLHTLAGAFDLDITCPHQGCGAKYTYRFTRE